MDGRAFLDIAQELVAGKTEAHWRAAAGRAYYALFHESWSALLRWSFSIPPRESAHSFIRLRFTFAVHPDLRQIGYALEDLSRLRNKADYKLAVSGQFASSQPTEKAINDARAALVLLDAINGDPIRQAVAIA